MKHLQLSTLIIFFIYFSKSAMAQDSLEICREDLEIVTEERDALEIENADLKKNASKARTKEQLYNSPIVRGFILTTENDVFGLGPNEDESYTGQFRFEFFLNGRLASDGLFGKKKIFFPFIKNKENLEFNLESVFLNGQGYTPARENFHRTDVVKEDRPYASFIDVGYQRTALFKKVLNTSELQIGFMGTNGANSIQNFLHAKVTTGSDSVKGWDNQIGYPGRFVVNYRDYGMFSPLEDLTSMECCKPQLGINYDLYVGGFMTYFQAGISLFNSAGNSALLNIGSNASLKNRNRPNKKDPHLVFGYQFKMDTRLVGWNSALMGLRRNDNSVHKIRSSEINRILFIPSAKLTFLFPTLFKKRNLLFTYQTHLRTREYKGGKGIHTWGSFSIGTFKKAGYL